ncbi:MAG: cation:proton antiporter [Spirulina sp.]
MLHSPLLAIEIDILVLLAIACLTAIALKRLKFPYTVALVLLGIGMGWLGQQFEFFEFFEKLSLSHDLILFVFVPPLIFESALNLDSRLLLRNLVPILTLAAPGLLISTAIVGSILNWGTDLDLPQALLFGSLISATDPVAVIALFKELGAPKRLGILVEGESLFNDATAIVTFNIILAVIATGQGFGLSTLQQGGWDFLISFIGGIAIGSIIGFAMQFPLSLSKDNPLVLATLTTIVAYATFSIAEEVIYVSGVIAVVSAGIILGWYKENNLKPEARNFLGEFWEYLAFLANSLIFLLVGLTVSGFQFFLQVEQTQGLLEAIGLTLLAILLARGIVVFGLTAIVNRLQPEAAVELPYQLVSFWGGLRGAVCLALALSFDPDFPNRDLMLMLTLGVVLFTLLLPGTTIAALLRKLELDLPPLFDRLNQALTFSLAQQEALEQLPVLETIFVNPQPEMLAAYRQNRLASRETARQSLVALCQSPQLDEQTRQQWVWSIALNLEQQTYQRIYDLGFMNEMFLSQFKLTLELQQDAVAAGQIPPPLPEQLTLEVRLTQLQLQWGEKWMPQQAWVKALRSQARFKACLYWAILTRVTEILPTRLEELFQNSGLEIELIEPCIAEYRQWHEEARQEFLRIGSESDSLMLALQTQIAEGVARHTQKETIENAIATGAIGKTAGSSLLQ